MPIYEYRCPKCWHKFSRIEQMSSSSEAYCSRCGVLADRLISLPSKSFIRHNESLPCGNGSEGRYVSSQETGGLPVLIPSWGAMEKEEVDYVAGMAIEKERDRVKRKQKSATKERLEQVVEATRQAPRGERAEAAQGAIDEMGG